MEPSEKQNSPQLNSQERRRKEDIHRMQGEKRVRQMLFLLVGIFAAAFCLFSYYQRVQAVFGSYAVVKEYEKNESSQVKYVSYGNKILKYSKDGAAVIDANGNSVWNGSYTMKNPAISVCGNYLAIADIGGKELYVFNGEDFGKEIQVFGNIIQADVGNQGIVAVAMEDGDSSLIDIYDPYQSNDSLRVQIPTMVNEDGFPIDIALSDDGQKLVTGFIDIADGVMENKATFYNFDEVGQNDINRQTGMVNFESTLLSKLEFLNNNIICAFTENGFHLYSMKERQESIADVTFEQTIKSVMSSGTHVGVVLEEYETEEKYRLLIYNLEGKKVLDETFQFDYDQVLLTSKEVIFTSELSATIIRLNGKKKFEKDFDQNITALLPYDNNRKYYLISDYKIQIIEIGND